MKQRLTAVMYGWLSIVILLLLTSMTLALFLRFTSLTNPLLNQLAVMASFLILFISGLISGIKAKQKGWIIGMMLSLSYSLVIYLFHFLGYGEHFTFTQLLYHLGFLMITIVGSIFGVNLTGSKEVN
ncbi:TIGR04086 family membrane protein [Amphibacillus indicireducens]|uniref:TIGR04086 family membrane protein n=1 Tax=Amphibacillus indicireducens TaxID=1076330 RepID=A0ABP7VCT5_9BACI